MGAPLPELAAGARSEGPWVDSALSQLPYCPLGHSQRAEEGERQAHPQRQPRPRPLAPLCPVHVKAASDHDFGFELYQRPRLRGQS